MKSHLNLLPKSSRNYQYVKTSLIAWGLITIVAGSAMVIGIQREKSRVSQTSQELTMLRQKLVPVKHVANEIAKLESEIANRGTESNFDCRALESHPTVALLGTIGQSATSEICVRSLNQFRTGGQFKLLVTGIGVNNSAIALFAAGLERSGKFHEVNLKSTVEEMIAGKSAQRYEIECTY